MTSPLKISLFELEEKDSRFRADYLHFLQLANTYIVQIFFQTFNDGRRRKQLYEWLNSVQQHSVWNKERVSSDIFNNIVPTSAGRSGYLDAYNVDFARMLQLMASPDEGLPQAARRFYRNLNLFHAIPLSEEEFPAVLELLRKKRNWLKDFTRRRSNPAASPDDTQVIHALGLLLLPKLQQHFIGAVRSGLARQRRREQCLLYSIQYHFRKACKERREATRQVFGARKRGRVDKKLRRDAEQAKQAFMRQYEKLYPQGKGPRYTFHQFRIRQAFIGKTNLRWLLELLRAQEGQAHFSRDIEPLHDTAMQINKILNEAFLRMHEADKAELERLRHEKGLTKRQARDELSEYACLRGEVRELRNHVAHNGLFCFFRPSGSDRHLSAREVFRLVFRALKRPHNPRWRAQAHEMSDRIRALLKKQNVVWAFPRENGHDAPPKVIRRWREKERAEYLDFGKWRLDRRCYVRNVFSRWNNALQGAKKECLRKTPRA